VVDDGADIVDIGGVRAGPGAEVSVAEEIDRVAPVVEAARAARPDVVISVDTFRAEVAREVVRLGCDLINDSWGGSDEGIVQVAAETGAGLVCSHVGGLAPRTDPHRVAYDDVVADVVRTVTGLAERAVAAGVRPDGILIDPCHDFAKNTYHSLEVTRRLDELTATGWPVLVALSNKDFIGESLGLDRLERLPGTLAATVFSAMRGARVFRAHNVPETRQALDMLSVIQGDRPPLRTLRALV
jgi:dihydropteroate synthase